MEEIFNIKKKFDAEIFCSTIEHSTIYFPSHSRKIKNKKLRKRNKK